MSYQADDFPIFPSYEAEIIFYKADDLRSPNIPFI